MKLYLTFFSLLVLNISCLSQDTTNLIPNWSFEIKDSCPNTYMPLEYVSTWVNANTSTPNYFSSCNDTISDVPKNFGGYQFARNGNSYIGFYLYLGNNENREYVSIELLSPLIKDSKYCFEIYYSLAEISMVHTNSFQIHLSVDSVFQNDVYRIDLPYQMANNNLISNDTVGWQRTQSFFLANGGEKYLTFGNFKPDTASNLQLTGWGVNGGAYYYFDAVRLYDCTEPDTTVFETSLFPNPNNGTFSVNYNLGENRTAGNFRIYDAIGKLVYDERLTQNNGSLGLNLYLSSGLYFWEIRDEDSPIQKDKFVISR